MKYLGKPVEIFKSNVPVIFPNNGEIMVVGNEEGNDYSQTALVLAYLPNRHYPVITESGTYRYCAKLPNPAVNIPEKSIPHDTYGIPLYTKGVVTVKEYTRKNSELYVLAKKAVENGQNVLFISNSVDKYPDAISATDTWDSVLYRLYMHFFGISLHPDTDKMLADMQDFAHMHKSFFTIKAEQTSPLGIKDLIGLARCIDIDYDLIIVEDMQYMDFKVEPGQSPTKKLYDSLKDIARMFDVAIVASKESATQAEPRMLTNHELAQWCSTGRGQAKSTEIVVDTWNYPYYEDNDECGTNVLARKWGDTEWHRADVDYCFGKEA